MAMRRNRLLLLAGVVAVAAYAVGDLLSGLLYDGYSFRDQAISELSANGSPVRPTAVTWIAFHGVLGIAFGVALATAATFLLARLTNVLTALLAVLADGADGIYQVSGAQDISYAEAARHLARPQGAARTRRDCRP